MLRLTTVLVALAALAGCDLTTDPPPVVFAWQGVLQPEPGWDIQGDVAVSWIEGTGEILVGIVVEGDEPQAVRPWHVHHNTCLTGGGIVGNAADYPPLDIQADGIGVVEIHVPAALDPESAYHVNVHLSLDELETIIACADLIPF